MIFFGAMEFFFVNFDFKMDVKMNFRIITKNHSADSKIRSAQKIAFRAVGTHESHPTACGVKGVFFRSTVTVTVYSLMLFLILSRMVVILAF